jgi:hypothetical protein
MDSEVQALSDNTNTRSIALPHWQLASAYYRADPPSLYLVAIPRRFMLDCNKHSLRVARATDRRRS